MAPDKLTPSDPRATHHRATVRGKTYHYLLVEPHGQPAGTILLCHGFPDISLGWRYQAPFLASLGLRVVIPDMLGYGQTDAPDAVEPYSHKSMAADMAELAAQVAPGERIFLGGHDWGGALVWRIVLWHPNLVRAVFSICTPYWQPSPQYLDPEAYAERLPNFRYQLYLAGPELPREIQGVDRTRQFLNGLGGGRGPAGATFFDTASGARIDLIGKLGRSPLFDPAEIDFYAAEIARHGLRGPTNWYRTRRLNYEEELELLASSGGQPKRIRVPSLLISATDDKALPPALSQGMERHFDNLTKHVAKGNHFVHWTSPDEINGYLRDFLVPLLKDDAGPPAKASI